MSGEINYKVSILVANYNNEIYLDNCLNSLLNQSYKNFEVIVIDDKSSDQSLEVLKKYKEKILIAQKEYDKTEVGSYDQIASYYEALKISTGEIIFLCDSDDYFDQYKIENVVNKFNENQNYKMVYDFPILKFSENNKFLKRKKKLFKNYWSHFQPTSCISIKRKELLNYYNSISFNNFPDIWLDFRLGVLSKYIFKNLVFVNKNLTFYRQTKTNISSKFKFLSKNWWIRRAQAHDYIIFFFEKNNIQHVKNLDFFVTKFINKYFL